MSNITPTEPLSELRQDEELETFTLYGGETIVAESDDVTELFDGTYARNDDGNLVELHDGSFAIDGHHDIVRLHNDDYALSDYANYCEGYAEYYLEGDGEYFSHRWYSYHYLDENTFICEHCDDRYWNDDYATDGLCDSCHNEDDEEESGERNYGTCMVHPYSDKTIGRRRPEGEGPLYYGIELEVEVRARANFDQQVRTAYQHFGFDYVILKHDGSIGDSGFEMVTRPDTLDVHKRKWAGWIDKASQSLSSWCNGRCGMHVHISRAALSQLQLGKMLVWVNHANNAALVKTIAGRSFEQMNRWCKQEGGKKISDAKKEESDNRYVAINVSMQTAEVRIFRGTLKPESFYKNLEFCDALVGFCAPTNHSIKDIEKPEPFLRYVLAHAKRYPNLHAFLERRRLYVAHGITPQPEEVLS